MDEVIISGSSSSSSSGGNSDSHCVCPSIHLHVLHGSYLLLLLVKILDEYETASDCDSR